MLTLADLLINLRQKLLDARAQADMALAQALFTTYDLILEASYPSKNRALSGILQDFVDSARDTLNGEDWKSTIPTIEQIVQASGKPSTANED
jgi:hypothetical protein